MIEFKRVNRGRIICTGLLAIFLAGGVAWASPTDSKGSKSTKGSKGSKGKCFVDADCGDGSFCKAKDNKCHKKDKNYCATDADCGDGSFCKAKDNKCHKKDKNYCASDADCKDGNVCRNDNKCHKDDRKCDADSDCKTGELCGQDGKCHKDNGESCSMDSDCKAGEHCAADGKCYQDDSCDDSDPCTIDKVTDGVCGHIPVADCQACDTAADCDDTDACTTDICTKKSTCDHRMVEGCAHCTAAADCDDSDTCTSEECGADGSCQITVDPTCEPVAPQAAEICGNCIDDNNDGLTDFEDPSCCSNPVFTMNLVKAQLLTKKGGTNLRLRSALLPPTLTGVNALDHDIYVQIRGAAGSDVLCAHIPAQNFKRVGKTIRFKSRNMVASAQGIKRIALTLRKRGFARVQVLGKQMPMSHLQTGPTQITLGFYNADLGNEETRCASTMASFRSSKRSALVAP